MKINVSKLEGVPLTLLIPLHIRAVESKKKKPLIYDEKAIEMMDGIDFDFSKLKIKKLSTVSSMFRIRKFDKETKDFITRNPKGTIVNIGCGLDTRFSRIDNGQITWYDMDFQEVIDIKRNFFEETPRYKFISLSASDFDWINKIQEKRNVLFLAEGVFMYLEEKNVKDILLNIVNNFENSKIVFDLCTKFIVKKSKSFLPPMLRESAVFHFGVDKGTEIEKWDNRIKLEEEWFYYNLKEDIGFYKILNFIPVLNKGFKILKYLIN